VAAWLLAHKHYPETARQSHEEGAVTVTFTVARDGRVLSVALTATSHYDSLDDATTATLRDAQLPPFPPDMTGSQTVLTVTLKYSLER
jgi:TonB family protein